MLLPVSVKNKQQTVSMNTVLAETLRCKLRPNRCR